MTDLINPHLELPGVQQAMLVYFSGVGHVTRGTLGGEASKHHRAFESALRMLGEALRTLGGLRLTRFGGHSKTWDCSLRGVSENAEDETAVPG
ncbi:MAG: hypothetical protein OXF41_20810 [bacterium]|nr:hypothetical protein [bacterium]